MNPSLKRNECVRQCRYTYSSGERLDLGRELADEYQSLDTTNNDLDRIKKDFKARIETHESRIQTLAEQVRSGYSLRDTICFWDINQPEPGKKQLRRADTLEIIETADMTEADKQLGMEEVDDAAVNNGAHPNAHMALTDGEETEEKKPTTKPKGPPPRRASGPGVVEVDADEGSYGEDEDDRNKL